MANRKSVLKNNPALLIYRHYLLSNIFTPFEIPYLNPSTMLWMNKTSDLLLHCGKWCWSDYWSKRILRIFVLTRKWQQKNKSYKVQQLIGAAPGTSNKIYFMKMTRSLNDAPNFTIWIDSIIWLSFVVTDIRCKKIIADQAYLLSITATNRSAWKILLTGANHKM